MYAEKIKKNVIFLLYAWGDSLKLLWSSRIKLTFFGIYRALSTSYWILFTKFWWLIVVSVVISRFVQDISLQIGLVDICGFLWGILTVLAIRPSVGLKTYRYFISFWYFAATAFILSLVFHAFKPLLVAHPVGFFSLAIGIYSPIYICCAFFVSDSVSSYKDIALSIQNGVKMVLYNYPLFLVVHGVLFIIWRLLFLLIILFFSKPFAFIFGSLYLYYVRILLLPAYACVINTLYIQRRHEQSELYL